MITRELVALQSCGCKACERVSCVGAEAAGPELCPQAERAQEEEAYHAVGWCWLVARHAGKQKVPALDAFIRVDIAWLQILWTLEDCEGQPLVDVS